MMEIRMKQIEKYLKEGEESIIIMIEKYLELIKNCLKD